MVNLSDLYVDPTMKKLSMLSEIHALASRPSYEKARAEAMGFVFGQVHVDHYADKGVRIKVDFKCVCGTAERYQEIISALGLERIGRFPPEHFDYAAKLRKLGSFDRGHLLNDGYAPAEVDRILALGEAFDESAKRALARNYPREQIRW